MILIYFKKEVIKKLIVVFYMKFINWIIKNYLIVILFIVAILILIIKINIRIKENNEVLINSKTEDIKTNLIKPSIISQPTEVIKQTLYNNKTKEEIIKMDPEERYTFIGNLSRDEAEELDMMTDYDFSDFLPFSTNNFIAQKFDYQNKKLTVKPLIEDKDKIKEEVNSWLFYENGNNPRKIEIIWSQ